VNAAYVHHYDLTYSHRYKVRNATTQVAIQTILVNS